MEYLTLVISMLQYEESNRIGIDDLLRHPYIIRDLKTHQKIIRKGMNMAKLIMILNTKDP